MEFQSCRQSLISRYEKDEHKVKIKPPKTIEPKEQNLEAYFALVDYITACLARLLVRSAQSAYWNNSTIAILAKWASKLKVLAYDPAEYASRSLANAEELLVTLRFATTDSASAALKLRVSDKTSGSKEPEIQLEEDSEGDITGLYYTEQWRFRKAITYLLRHVTKSLYASERSGNSADCFEVCTQVYETGLEKSMATISSNRDSDISASSNAMYTKCTYTAMELLMRNTRELTKRKVTPTNFSIRAKALWAWSMEHTDNIDKTGQLQTCHMDELVSILVPLSLADSHCSLEVVDLISTAAILTEDEDPLLQFEPVHFQVKYHLATSAWAEKEKRLASPALRFHDMDVRLLSRSPLDRPIRGKQ
jgi:hypothetical protein